jgi:hypothetical protein
MGTVESYNKYREKARKDAAACRRHRGGFDHNGKKFRVLEKIKIFLSQMPENCLLTAWTVLPQLCGGLWKSLWKLWKQQGWRVWAHMGGGREGFGENDQTGMGCFALRTGGPSPDVPVTSLPPV